MKLSIIVRCCNQKESLGRCIDSVLAQDIACDKEIILCDCDSTDGSAEVIRDYAERFPGVIRLLSEEEKEETVDEDTEESQEDGFVSDAAGSEEAEDAEDETVPQITREKLLLQKAFEQSTGEFISICEAADVWTDVARCRKLLESLNIFPSAEVAFHDAYVQQRHRLAEPGDEPFGDAVILINADNAVQVAAAVPSLSCGLYKRDVIWSVPSSFYLDTFRVEMFNHFILKNHLGCWQPERLAVCVDSRDYTKTVLHIAQRVWQDMQYAKQMAEVHAAGCSAEMLLDILEKRFVDYCAALKLNPELNTNEAGIEDIASEVTLRQLSGQLKVLQREVGIVKTLTQRTNARTEKSHSILQKLLRMRLFHKEKQIKENKLTTKYYALGIRVFKRTEPTVNYGASIGLVPYKYVHILHKNILTLQIVKILNRHFPQNEHAFVFNSGASESNTGKLFGKNIFYGSAATLIINPDITERIIVHGIFSPRLVNYLYNNRHLLSRTYWCIYGGDLYASPNDEPNNYIRANFHAIITTFDKQEYEKRFGEKKTYDMVFNNPLSPHLLPPSGHTPGKPYRILINNSADETTLEAFDVLSKFKDENIEIATILSYTTFGSNNIIPRIIEKGREIFGEKFKPVYEWMSLPRYVEFLSGIDVYTSFQNRQQGVGNMSAAMLMGKKVFIRSSVSTYIGYHANGIRVADTNEIENMSFEEFVSLDDDIRESNIRILHSRMTEENQIKLWEKVIYE